MQNKNLHTGHTITPFEDNARILLGREPIVLDTTNIQREINGSIVLITGAAGSIGSELAMQICSFNPAKLILTDQAETALNDLDLYLGTQFRNVDIAAFVANITDASRMKSIIRQTKPHIIFHAAAYKHVPFMEKHPYEAIKTNVFGVEILARLALTYQVRKFIFISTDKAVNPASIMGATKRVAEMYLQQLSKAKQGSTAFIITRFGNVLRSNGSFLLTFEKQILEGGPVTVTHSKVSRYMITAAEACQLVLEASATGENGQILSFDMGQPILIEDIARRMIALSKQRIAIEYTGLRPGEKLREELFFNDEKSNLQAKIRTCQSNIVRLLPRTLETLRKALKSGNDETMIAALKTIVPEFKPIKQESTLL
jgi:FlaA1/EpsC-like NDP-sugar epimerase